MRKGPFPEEQHDFFSTECHGSVLVIRFKGNLLHMATDLNARNKLLNLFDRVEKEDSIKVIVILSSPDRIGRQELLEFYRHIFRSKMGIDSIHRMFNIVDQVILKIVALSKTVVYAAAGKMILLFLNISLACDYRIVADNTLFENPYLEMGSVSKGGGLYFLAKMLGPLKASRLLLSGKNISAKEAFALGIVDRVVSIDRYEEQILSAAHEFSRIPAGSMIGTKKLTNFHSNDLKNYLELENQILLRIIRTPDLNSAFWEKVMGSR
jgi:enoyl-CoA hydratase/carnithine racemase